MTESHPSECLVAFGSNQGDSESYYEQAVSRLGAIAGQVVKSRLLRTPAIGGLDEQPDFFNGALRFTSQLSPQELHQSLIEIERSLGRRRETRWGARTIDMDLLLYGRQEVSSPHLTIPHPRMSFRRFVLEPANEIAAELIHPTSGLTIKDLLDHLDHVENKLCWITADVAAATAVCGKISDEFDDWKIEVVPHGPDAAQIDPIPKLLVIDEGFGLQGPIPLPLLNVSGLSESLRIIEIRAALKAMAPICSDTAGMSPGGSPQAAPDQADRRGT